MRESKLPLLLLMIATLLLPLIFQSPYHIQILTQLLIWTILFTALDIAVGHAGLVSVAHGALFGLGAYVTGILAVKAGWGFWETLPPSILVGAAVGLFIGLLTLRMGGHYFVIAMLGIGLLITIIIRSWSDLTNGELGLSPIPASLPFDRLPLDRSLAFYYLMALVSGVCVIGAYALMRTSTGRRLRAIRDNPALAAAVGIDVSRTRLVAFLVSSGMAALAGSFQASYLSYIDPSLASYEVGFTALMAVIIGGRASVAGPYLGAAIFVILPELLRTADEYRPIVLGVVLILVVLFAPEGLAGWARSGIAAIRERFTMAKPGRGGEPLRRGSIS